MSENHEIVTLGRRLDALTAAVRKQANRRPAMAKYALLGVAALGLGVVGWEGRRLLVGREAVEATLNSKSMAADAPQVVRMPIASCFVTSNGTLLLNSKRLYKDEGNVVIAIPAGAHTITKETKNAIVGRSFVGETTLGSYAGRPQLVALPDKFEIR
jgi:hypothetical protein